MKKALLFSAALTAGLFLGNTTTWAEYPEKPVEFVIPFPPGDLEDILTRMIAEEFQATYDVPAAVINRPGGGGGPFPGAVSVAVAPADGYTVGSFVLDVAVIGHLIGIPELADQPFEPIGVFLTYPFILAVGKDAPYGSMEELAAYAQDNDVAVGHFGAGATPTEVTMAAQSAFGFRWGSDAAFDALDCNTLASGDADVINTTLQLVQPCIDEITPLASITLERISILPDVPTMGELKPELELSTWNGLFVHRDVPQEARDKIAAVAQKVMASEKAQNLAVETGAKVYWLDSAQSAALIEKDGETVGRIAKINAE